MQAPVQVDLSVPGQIVVHHQTHLLHVYSSSPHIRGDEHSTACVCRCCVCCCFKSVLKKLKM